MISNKENGAYYTPSLLADFIVFHLFDKYDFSNSINVLEPSSGDGNFFDSMFSNTTFKGRFKLPKNITIDAIEKDKEEIEISKKKNKKRLLASQKINYFNEDYLEFNKKNKKKFDLVIGNPPYIKSNYLTKKQIESCEAIHKGANLSPKSIKNIWTSFLISGVQSLNENGVICFVLPAELLQVIYAKELRGYLRDNFQKIEIFAFNELIFPDIEQDVIILICAKKQTPGVSFYHVDKLEDLKEPTYVEENSNIHRQTLDKWTNYILLDKELKFLDTLKTRFLPIKNYCRAEVGIVTAANDYFIVDKEIVEKYKLQNIAKPILQKGSLMPSTNNFTKVDQKNISKRGKPAFFLRFEDVNQKSFSKEAKEYLKIGEDRLIDQRYKCKLRNNWYFVPSVWVSEGIFTKRSNLFPRMAMNEAKSYVTDAFYRIRMKDENKVSDLVFSFYNTLTLIFAELEGRYYGGGVLELTPNEYKNLSIPYCKKIKQSQLEKLDNMLRTKVGIKDVLRYTDEIILKDYYKMSNEEIAQLKTIHAKLVTRRLKNRKLGF
ncbi:MAG: N-6 DNA methylase [Candidatus Paceibacterota bacterium]